MTTEYHVKLIQTGNTQTLTIPQDLTLSTTDVTIRQEDGKLIIEPYQKKSLLSVLATLEPLDEDFPNVDDGEFKASLLAGERFGERFSPLSFAIP